MTTLQALPGVQFIPPPAKLIPDLQHSMRDALTMLQGDERVAFVTLVTIDKHGRKSANVGVVAKLGQGKDWDLDAAVYMGKVWGERVEGTAYVRLSM